MLRREDEIMDRELKNVKQPTAAPATENKPDDDKDGNKDKEKKVDEKKEKDVDFDALKSLSDDGIDMSFLDSLKDKYEKDKQDEEAKKPKEEDPPALPTPEEMLSKTASLLEELKRVCNN